LENFGVLPLSKFTILHAENKQEAIIEVLIERKILIVTGRGYSKKYFILRELRRKSIKII